MHLGAISGPHAGRVIVVSERLTVGRSAQCELRLDDPKVSRRHATLLADDDGLTVRDDGSLNGTWLNDRRITGIARLHVGDRVRIGGSEFVVAREDEATDTWPSEGAGMRVPTEGATVLVGATDDRRATSA